MQRFLHKGVADGRHTIYQLRYETRAKARLGIVDWIEASYNR